MAASAEMVYWNAYAKAVRPEPYIDIAEWAEKHRVLSRVDTEEYGPWRNARTPYLVEIMKCLSPHHPSRFVLLMKGAQIGATQMGNNFLGYGMDMDPGPMMSVQPTVEMAKRNSRQRIDPMIEATPRLRDKVSPAKSRDSGNTMLSKEFVNGILVMTGANSAVGLRSMTVKNLFLDEEDGYPPDVAGEGDPAELAITRTRNFRRAKVFRASTPTIHEISRIESGFLAGDQRYYFVPCPHCDHGQRLRWGGPDAHFGVKYDKEEPLKASYLCEECHVLIENKDKNQMLRGGNWKATAVAKDPRLVSFHLSSLYSPWYSWGDAAMDWIKSKDNPIKLKWFVNTVLGETFKEKYRSVNATEEWVEQRTEVFPKDDEGNLLVPKEVAVITAGVDVQDDRLEMLVMGWGDGEESWTLERHIFYGDPAEKKVWQDLWKEIVAPRKMERGGVDYIRATGVDTRGHYTQEAYNFCKPRFRVRTPDGKRMFVFALAGNPGAGHIWPNKASYNNKGKVALWHIRVDAGKELIISRLLGIPEAGPGYMHYPKHEDFGIEFFKQLTAEKVVTRHDLKGFPRRVWEKKTPGARNETFDMTNYAIASLEGLKQFGLDLAKLVTGLSALKPTGISEDETIAPGGEKTVDSPPRPQKRGRGRRKSRSSLM